MLGGTGYSIIDLTAGAAAPKSHIELTAPTNGRVRVRGVLIGNSAATAAQGVEWQLCRLSATGTGTAIIPEKLDPDSGAARSSAKSTMTANGTKTGNAIWMAAWDIVGTYVLWFPPGVDIFVVNAGIVDVRKTIGADTTAWSVTLFFEE